jgi:hypothetical protein
VQSSTRSVQARVWQRCLRACPRTMAHTNTHDTCADQIAIKIGAVQCTSLTLSLASLTACIAQADASRPACSTLSTAVCLSPSGSGGIL